MPCNGVTDSALERFVLEDPCHNDFFTSTGLFCSRKVMEMVGRGCTRIFRSRSGVKMQCRGRTSKIRSKICPELLLSTGTVLVMINKSVQHLLPLHSDSPCLRFRIMHARKRSSYNWWLIRREFILVSVVANSHTLRPVPRHRGILWC